MSITYPKGAKNMYNNILGPPKFTQIGNFGMKIYHLATVASSVTSYFLKYWLELIKNFA
jgi:hypothetical protein